MHFVYQFQLLMWKTSFVFMKLLAFTLFSLDFEVIFASIMRGMELLSLILSLLIFEVLQNTKNSFPLLLISLRPYDEVEIAILRKLLSTSNHL